MTLDTREIEVIVAIDVFANSDGRAEEIVEEALTPHGSVIGWHIVTTNGSGEEAPDTGGRLVGESSRTS